jgi:hypothetical protein
VILVKWLAPLLLSPGFCLCLAGMMRGVILGVAVLFSAVSVAAGDIPAGELAYAPTAARVAALQAEAAQKGWTAVAAPLREVATGLYERRGVQAQSWYCLYRWAEMFGQTEGEAVNQWTDAARLAHVGYTNAFAEDRVPNRPLGGLAQPELQAFMMGSRDFSDQFFSLLSPLDHPSMVIRILAAIWREDPAEFRDYANLAIAIAVVYDVPPPTNWPHGQVSAAALRRGLFPPPAVFDFFVTSDKAGALLQPLRKLSAADLKYVVDISAGFDELRWAQQSVDTPLAGLGHVYGAVHYRSDRVAAGALVWPLNTYKLPEIFQEGGICVDQAYFAAMVGKAKGVPTLLFRGMGKDGGHAWFGFLDGGGQWQLDCGRYPDQKLVIGYAFDPQTWTDISDHELMFLHEGFRRMPLFKTSLMHRQFAGIYFGSGNFAAAAKAARAAVTVERRNLEAWYLLLAAQERMGVPPRQVEATLQEAASAFERYAGLGDDFKKQIVRSLRSRGQTSAADLLEHSIGRIDEPSPDDTEVQQTAGVLQRSMEEDSVDNTVRLYYSLLRKPRQGADIDFVIQVVRPFVEYVMKNERPDEAVQAVLQARRALRVEPDGQLDLELNALAEKARQAAGR